MGIDLTALVVLAVVAMVAAAFVWRARREKARLERRRTYRRKHIAKQRAWDGIFGRWLNRRLPYYGPRETED